MVRKNVTTLSMLISEKLISNADTDVADLLKAIRQFANTAAGKMREDLMEAYRLLTVIGLGIALNKRLAPPVQPFACTDETMSL